MTTTKTHHPTDAKITSDDQTVINFTEIGGVVHLNGEPALDAKGAGLRHRATCSVMCQRCKQNTVAAPLRVMARFEPALGRLMYWSGIALSWEELGALRCEKCRYTDELVPESKRPEFQD